MLSCLYDPLHLDVGIPLHDAQRGSQTELNVWPREPGALHWYSGSAVINAWFMAQAVGSSHLLELYEAAPETRAVLRGVLADPEFRQHQLTVRILPEQDDGLYFDGESHIESAIASWTAQDVILLDPFAMWRQPEHQASRDRYRSICEQLLALEDAPQLVLFWTWGRAFPVADADLGGTSQPARNGYHQLRQLLHDADRHFIRVRWRWGLQFAMWVVVPAVHLRPLEASVRYRCTEIRDHLRSHGCAQRLSSPDIEVTVDST
jgi:hypothetical protein